MVIYSLYLPETFTLLVDITVHMQTLKRIDKNIISFSVVFLLVFSLFLMASGELIETLCGTDCDDHCENSCESCGDCINCLPNTHMMLSSSNEIGISDRDPLWNVILLLERIEGNIATDIDHPPQNLL